MVSIIIIIIIIMIIMIIIIIIIIIIIMIIIMIMIMIIMIMIIIIMIIMIIIYSKNIICLKKKRGLKKGRIKIFFNDVNVNNFVRKMEKKKRCRAIENFSHY